MQYRIDFKMEKIRKGEHAQDMFKSHFCSIILPITRLLQIARKLERDGAKTRPNLETNVKSFFNGLMYVRQSPVAQWREHPNW